MEHPLFQHPAMAELTKALARESRSQLLAGALLWIAGIALGALFFRRHPLLAILAMAFIVLGVQWMYSGMRNRKLDHHPLMLLLHRQPQNIVWIYTVNFDVMPFGVQMIRRGDLHVRCADGAEHVVSLPAHRLKLVSHTLSRMLPHATFGYSPDKESAFLVNPELLRKPL